MGTSPGPGPQDHDSENVAPFPERDNGASGRDFQIAKSRFLAELNADERLPWRKKPSACRVARQLAECANRGIFDQTGHLVAWPGQQWLARRLGVKEDTARRAVRILEAFGYVKIVEKGKPGRGKSNRCRLLIPTQEDRFGNAENPPRWSEKPPTVGDEPLESEPHECEESPPKAPVRRQTRMDLYEGDPSAALRDPHTETNFKSSAPYGAKIKPTNDNDSDGPLSHNDDDGPLTDDGPFKFVDEDQVLTASPCSVATAGSAARALVDEPSAAKAPPVLSTESAAKVRIRIGCWDCSHVEEHQVSDLGLKYWAKFADGYKCKQCPDGKKVPKGFTVIDYEGTDDFKYDEAPSAAAEPYDGPGEPSISDESRRRTAALNAALQDQRASDQKSEDYDLDDYASLCGGGSLR